MTKRELINLTIINDSDCTLSIPLFQNNVTSINATTKYQWDITSANISCGFGSIVVNGVLISITYTTTLTGLVASLNALGYGFFCTEVIGANTYVYTFDDTNSYGSLDLCPTPITTSTTTSTTTIAPTTTTTTTSTTAIPTTSTTTTSTTPIPTTTTTTSTTTSTTTPTPTTTTTTTSSTTSTTTPIPTTTTTTSTTTTTTTIIAVFGCSITDTTFDTSAIFNLGTESGLVTITGSGLTAGDTYDIIYPVGGSIIHTTVPVDGSGNLSDNFYWIYDSVNSNAEITLILP